MTGIDLIRCYDGRLWEEEWWSYLLQDLDVREHRSADFSLVLPDAIYMINGTNSLRYVPEDFLRRVSQAGNPGILHLGDEFTRGPYSVYANFAYVLRSHYKSFLKSPALLNTPIGYSNEVTPSSWLPSSMRPLAWSFSGARGATRLKMGRVWKSFRPNHIYLPDLRAGEVHQTRQEFLDNLRDSVFVPCPMGNIHLESLRLYEALENGAIPILQRRAFFPYWEEVLGEDHMAPQFYNWEDARAWAEDLYDRPAALDRFQRQIIDWWQTLKDETRDQVSDFVAKGRSGALRDQVKRDFADKSDAAVLVPRFVEIARNHDLTALRGRMQVTIERMTGRLNKSTQWRGEATGVGAPLTAVGAGPPRRRPRPPRRTDPRDYAGRQGDNSAGRQSDSL